MKTFKQYMEEKHESTTEEEDKYWILEEGWAACKSEVLEILNKKEACSQRVLEEIEKL